MVSDVYLIQNYKWRDLKPVLIVEFFSYNWLIVCNWWGLFGLYSGEEDIVVLQKDTNSYAFPHCVANFM